jgi:hypothetical protein
MLKDFAWSIFELTGDIRSYFLYCEASECLKVEEIEKEDIIPEEKTAN